MQNRKKWTMQILQKILDLPNWNKNNKSASWQCQKLKNIQKLSNKNHLSHSQANGSAKSCAGEGWFGTA